jgi:RNA polymerase sigma-70 factor (ECF subfamily)
MLDRSSQAVHRALAAPVSSPSAQASRREQAALLADALTRLRPEYREVFILRHLDRVPIDEIAARMDRSPNAVRMLWTRAVMMLNRMLQEEP